MAIQIEIRNIRDLDKLRNLKNDGEYVVSIVNDLNFAEWNFYGSINATCDGTLIEKFIPIDLSNFKGVLFIKGSKHTFKGLKLEMPEQDDIGLFSKISKEADVEIRDLLFEDPVILGKEHVGTIVGNGSVVIRGCAIVGGTVTGISEVGGFVGQSNQLKIFDSESRLCVTGRNIAGAFVGKASEAEFMNCESSSLISTTEPTESIFYGVADGATVVESTTKQVGTDYTRIYPDKKPQGKRKRLFS